MSKEAILEKVRQTRNLPALPAVTLEILRLLQAEELNFDTLIDVIRRDPALAATILKVVNSSFYGVSRKVTSLKQATTVVGLNTVKMLVLSVSLVGMLRDSKTRKLDHAAYWRRSLFTAVASLLLAKNAAPKMAEDAFVAGLLSDIGVMVASICAPNEYLPVLELWNEKKGPLAAVEMEKLDITHAEIGRELLLAWNLPEILYETVGAHTGCGLPELSGDTIELVRIVRSASAIAEVFCHDLPCTELPHVMDFCQTETGIGNAVLEAALKALGASVKDLGALLSLPIGQPASYETIQAELALQLEALKKKAPKRFSVDDLTVEN